MSELKVGDRVKVEYESSIIGKNEHGFYLDFPYANLFIKAAHLTKIKPTLEVGQVWLCEKSRKRKILAIHDYEIAYELEGCTGIHLQDEESFIEDCAHTLISEAGI